MSVSLSLEIIISFAEVDVRYDVCEATREKVWISSSKKTTRGATTVDPSWMHNPIRGIREFHARIPKSQLHTRSYFADVHGWDLVSISQQNHRTIIQRHPDERRFYLCTGALTIHCSSSRYLFFFDDHEKECFWSCEVRTTWFVEQDAETFFEKLGDISSWQDASCYLSDVVKEMKNDVLLSNIIKKNGICELTTREIYHDMIALEFVLCLRRQDKSDEGRFMNERLVNLILTTQSPFHQYIINAVICYGRTIHNLLKKKVIGFGIIHDFEICACDRNRKIIILLHKWNALRKEVESQFLDISSFWAELSLMTRKT